MKLKEAIKRKAVKSNAITNVVINTFNSNGCETKGSANTFFWKS